MKELTAEKKMTVREVAEITGAAYRTVAAYAQRAGWTQNGKRTLLTEAQVTIILEAMKTPISSGTKSNLAAQVQGLETTHSRAFRIELLHKQIEAELQAEITELKAQAEADRPKAEFYDQVAGSADALQMRDVAGVLNLSGWGRNKLFDYLRKEGVLDDRNIPYRTYQDRGYFRVIEQEWTDKEGETHISLKTLVYQRGVDFIRKLIQEAA